MVNVDKVNRLVRDIIIESPHYGLILSSVNRYLSAKDKHHSSYVPTAGVYKEGINMHMVINPEFFGSLTRGQQLFTLLHELLHICFLHPTTRDRYSNKQLFNIAADLEINQYALAPAYAEGIEGICLLEDYGLQNEKEKGTDWYYKYLQNEMKNNTQVGKKCQAMCDAMKAMSGGQPQPGQGQPGDGEGGTQPGQPGWVDPHATWDDFKNMTDSEKRLVEGQALRQMARSISMDQKHIGNLPGHIKGMIEDFLFPKPTYNWRAVFRRLYTGYADTTYLKKTRKKESIRFPGMPAVRIKKHSRILCAIDTSGSISEEELIEFFTEVEGMRKAGVEIIVAECDTHISKPDGIYKYRNLNTIKGRQITGGGGTDFNDPIKYLNERSNMFNMLIYLTDGYAGVPRVKSVKPIVWVLSRNGKDMESFHEEGFPGYVIKIQDNVEEN